jgi:hypothetical protein
MQDQISSSRRNILGLGCKSMLSLAAIGVLANQPITAATRGRKSMMPEKADIDILNVALALEHEAIEAYQIGAESGLLQKAVLDVAVLFQGHHKAHRDALSSAISQMGGAAVAPRSRADYMAGLNVAAIKGQADILKLAQRLERGAANAYLGVIPAFNDKNLAQIGGKLASDETAHWALLSQALGETPPASAFVVS